MSESAYATLKRNASRMMSSMADGDGFTTLRFKPSHDGWSSARMSSEYGGIYMAVSGSRVKVFTYDDEACVKTEDFGPGDDIPSPDGGGAGKSSDVFMDLVRFSDELYENAEGFYFPVDLTFAFHCGMVEDWHRCSLVMALIDVSGDAECKSATMSAEDLTNPLAMNRIINVIGDMHSRRLRHYRSFKKTNVMVHDV